MKISEFTFNAIYSHVTIKYDNGQHTQINLDDLFVWLFSEHLSDTTAIDKYIVSKANKMVCVHFGSVEGTIYNYKDFIVSRIGKIKDYLEAYSAANEIEYMRFTLVA